MDDVIYKPITTLNPLCTSPLVPGIGYMWRPCILSAFSTSGAAVAALCLISHPLDLLKQFSKFYFHLGHRNRLKTGLAKDICILTYGLCEYQLVWQGQRIPTRVIKVVVLKLPNAVTL